MMVLMDLQYDKNGKGICGTRLAAARLGADFHLIDCYATHVSPDPSLAKAGRDIPKHCDGAKDLHSVMVGLTQWARKDDVMVWTDSEEMHAFQQLWNRVNKRKSHPQGILLDDYWDAADEKEDDKVLMLQKIRAMYDKLKKYEEWNLAEGKFDLST